MLPPMPKEQRVIPNDFPLQVDHLIPFLYHKGNIKKTFHNLLSLKILPFEYISQHQNNMIAKTSPHLNNVMKSHPSTDAGQKVLFV